ncbi:hypothetical protein PCI56_00780 [Plesiomonas shigelloides subsp. oncorhynchi]|nr:hypothetical protein [Plesiomonas shigelloides]
MGQKNIHGISEARLCTVNAYSRPNINAGWRPSGFKWIQRASELNYAPAQCDEAAEYMQMLKKQKKQSDKDRYSERIRALVKKSSDGRFARCQLVYSMDSSLTKEESIGLLISAARQRNADAQALLAEVYESGYGLYKKI